MSIESERTDNRSIFSYQRMLFRYHYAKKYLKKGTVLDIGCGYGYQAAFMKDYAYVGVDYYPEAAVLAKRAFPRAEFLSMQAPPLSFKDESFDNVICAEMIEHVKPPLAPTLLEECFRVLKNGGIFFLSTPNAANRLQKAPDHYTEYTVEEISAMLRRAGFHVFRRGGLSVDLVKNRFDAANKFNAFRKNLYAAALSKGKDADGGSGNGAAEKSGTQAAIRRGASPVKTVLRASVRIGLTGLSKLVVRAGYFFPKFAEYQVWICGKG